MSYYNIRGLKHHISSIHTGYAAQSLVKCEDCGKAFKTSESLRMHKVSNHQEINFVCSIDSKGCGLVFETESLLRTHFKTHPFTDFRNANLFGCTKCDKTFKARDGLGLHTAAIHKKEKPFTCTYCLLKFTRKYVLNSHIKLHTGYDCKYCNQKFSRKSILKIHMEEEHEKMSSKPRKQKVRRKCDLCEYTTHCKNLLKIHKWKHTGKKPYKCPKCDCAKTRIWGLRQHLLRWHEYTEEDLVDAKLYSAHHSVKIKPLVE